MKGRAMLYPTIGLIVAFIAISCVAISQRMNLDDMQERVDDLAQEIEQMQQTSSATVRALDTLRQESYETRTSLDTLKRHDALRATQIAALKEQADTLELRAERGLSKTSKALFSKPKKAPAKKRSPAKKPAPKS